MHVKKLSITIGVALAAVAVAAAFLLAPRNTPITGLPAPEATPPVGAANTALGFPSRLIIPVIKVNAPVEKKGLAGDGTLGVPKGPSTVAWYQYGPRPGDAGSAVITGHYGPWQTGAHSVFDDLNKLEKGDRIEVKDDKGNSIFFIVTAKKMYSKDAPASEVAKIFNQNHGAHLNLITCSGTWLANQKTYTERLVVFTDLVS